MSLLLMAICLVTIQHANAQYWSLTGNAGTNGSTNFIGTTDNVGFKIRTNNAVRITVNGSGKVGIGITTPVYKLDIKGGSINTDSVYRIGGNTVLSVKGAQNTFVGRNSGFSNSTGSGNTATGFEALFTNTTGTQNVANGFHSLHGNTTGGYNIGIGNYALNSNNGSYNTSTGYQSMYTNSTGIQNVAYGMQALYTNSTGTMNSSFGSYSMFYNTTGSKNIANGFSALYHNTTGNSNIAIGNATLSSNTVGGDLIAIGDSALYSQAVDNSLPYRYCNIAIGSGALYSNTSGHYNTAIGNSSLRWNVTGDGNTAVGTASLLSNTGYSNSATGSMALLTNTTGFSCSAFGSSAGANSNGSYNTFFGASSGMNTLGGSDNCFIGEESGITNQTGFSNTCIGNTSDFGTSGLFNASAIGYGAIVNTSNKIRLGNGVVTVIEGNSVYTVSDGRFKTNIHEEVKGLEFINKLRPVVYNFEAKKFDDFLNKNRPASQAERINGLDYTEVHKIRYSGFIAQEVEQAAKQTGYDFNGVHIPQNNDDNYSLAYAEFVVPLVKAVQELDKKNTELLKRIEELEKESGNKNKMPELQRPNGTTLEQNQPNPFSENSVIKYYIPQNAGSGVIKIYAPDGSEIKSIPVSTKGFGQTEISGNVLSAGTYSYILFVDGKVADTKQMIITK